MYISMSFNYVFGMTVGFILGVVFGWEILPMFVILWMIFVFYKIEIKNGRRKENQ